MAQTEGVEVSKDILTGNLIVINNLTKESQIVTWDKLVGTKWQQTSYPSWVKAAIAEHLRMTNTIDKMTERKPHKVDDDGKVQRKGDKWFSWGLLRTKFRANAFKDGGVHMVQAVIQVSDSDEVERHATMAGSGDTMAAARDDLLQHMYEMKATIEDAIASIKGGVDGKTEG